MLLDLLIAVINCEYVKYGCMTIKSIPCSFMNENGKRYDGSTTLRVNDQNVLAINSPRVCV